MFFFDDLYKKASYVFHELWTKSYFKYDNSSSQYHDYIFADQMLCNWYPVSCKLGRTITEPLVRKSIDQVLKTNKIGYNESTLGLLNGVRPAPDTDLPCPESQEITPSVTYSVAAAMLQIGLKNEAFQLLSETIDTLYNKLGYIYQLPSVLYSDGSFKEDLGNSLLSSGGIWAFQFCYEQEKLNQVALASEEYYENLEQYMTIKVADTMTHKEERKKKIKHQKEEEDEGLFNSVTRTFRRSLSFIME